MDGAEDPFQFFILSRIVSIELSRQFWGFFQVHYVKNKCNTKSKVAGMMEPHLWWPQAGGLLEFKSLRLAWIKLQDPLQKKKKS